MNTAQPTSTPPRVLLIDDDRDVHQAVSVLFERSGIELVAATNPDEAYSALALDPIDAILLDLNFTRGRTQGEEGFVALSRLLGDDPDAAVVVITGHSGVRIAVAAMQAGATDFVMKPWRNQELLERVRAAIAYRRQRNELAPLERAGDSASMAPRLLGASDAMGRVREMIRRVAPTAANLIILGAAGSGRSLVAQTIHRASLRAESELVTLDATAASDLSDEPASIALQRAAGGTLLLRHVDKLGDSAQSRLLTCLADNIRVIATGISTKVLSPRFRARVGVVEIHIPPLARRDGDAVLLARHFLHVARRRHGRPARSLTPEAEAAIAAADWADDVRGLALAVERAVVLGEGASLTEADLGFGMRPGTEAPPLTGPTDSKLNLKNSERTLVEAALRRHGFNVSRAAEDLGVSRAGLYRRMAKHGL